MLENQNEELHWMTNMNKMLGQIMGIEFDPIRSIVLILFNLNIKI
jgi:hypothetical protein